MKAIITILILLTLFFAAFPFIQKKESVLRRFLDWCFINQKWYRNRFFGRTFICIKTNGKNSWKDAKNYIKGQYVLDVDGVWYNQLKCNHCGSELFYSQSEVSYDENTDIATFKCNHCRKIQHAIWGIIPGYIHCNENGDPFDASLLHPIDTYVRNQIKKNVKEKDSVGGVACDGCPKESTCDFKECDQ